MSETPVRVLVVDDSAFMRTAMRRMIVSDPLLQIIDTASDGIEAIEKAVRIRPDVITLDVEMPRLNGLACLRRIMAEAPCPVIMVSSLTSEGAEVSLEALDLGAFDCVPKPSSYASLKVVDLRDELNGKIHAAHNWWSRKKRFKYANRVRTFSSYNASPASSDDVSRRSTRWTLRPAVVCIGSSTGGPRALQQVIAGLPGNLSVPVLIAQHMPQGFTGPFARRLNAQFEITVKEAEDGEPLKSGSVYIAPGGMHLTPAVGEAGYVARVSKMPSGCQHQPSVDVLMTAAATVFGNRAMGVILTGMGNDGELGMGAIYHAGGYTVGQNSETCVVYGMPRACAEAHVLHRELPLESIAPEIAAMSAIQTVHSSVLGTL